MRTVKKSQEMLWCPEQVNFLIHLLPSSLMSWFLLNGVNFFIYFFFFSLAGSENEAVLARACLKDILKEAKIIKTRGGIEDAHATALARKPWIPMEHCTEEEQISVEAALFAGDLHVHQLEEEIQDLIQSSQQREETLTNCSFKQLNPIVSKRSKEHRLNLLAGAGKSSRVKTIDVLGRVERDLSHAQSFVRGLYEMWYAIVHGISLTTQNPNSYFVIFLGQMPMLQRCDLIIGRGRPLPPCPTTEIILNRKKSTNGLDTESIFNRVTAVTIQQFNTFVMQGTPRTIFFDKGALSSEQHAQSLLKFSADQKQLLANANSQCNINLKVVNERNDQTMVTIEMNSLNLLWNMYHVNLQAWTQSSVHPGFYRNLGAATLNELTNLEIMIKKSTQPSGKKLTSIRSLQLAISDQSREYTLLWFWDPTRSYGEVRKAIADEAGKFAN